MEIASSAQCINTNTFMADDINYLESLPRFRDIDDNKNYIEDASLDPFFEEYLAMEVDNQVQNTPVSSTESSDRHRAMCLPIDSTGDSAESMQPRLTLIAEIKRQVEVQKKAKAAKAERQAEAEIKAEAQRQAEALEANLHHVLDSVDEIFYSIKNVNYNINDSIDTSLLIPHDSSQAFSHISFQDSFNHEFSYGIQPHSRRSSIALLFDDDIKSLPSIHESRRNSDEYKPCNTGMVVKGSKNKCGKLFEFDYSKYNIPSILEYGTGLVNTARFDCLDEKKVTNNQTSLIELQSQTTCKITRTRYLRSISDFKRIKENHKLIVYESNRSFSISKPYEYQIVRSQIDHSNGLPFNQTRAGLCPYCPEVKFFNIKNSSYSQHIASNHGVFPDNYLAPEPYNFGTYKVKKSSEHRKTMSHERERDGVICPVCHEIIEANCSKVTRNARPLMGYLRHFKQVHRKGKPGVDPQRFFQEVSKA